MSDEFADDDIELEDEDDSGEVFAGELPNGDWTEDEELYRKTWVAFAAPVLEEFEELDLTVYGFDPNVGYRRSKGQHLDLPMDFHRVLNDRLYELKRSREFFFAVVRLSKERGFYDDIKQLISGMMKYPKLENKDE